MSKRGGPREGAGRKPSPDARHVGVCIRLNAEERAAYDKLGADKVRALMLKAAAKL